MDVYLAGVQGRPFVVEELMDFYIGAPYSEIRQTDRKECYGDMDLYLAIPHSDRRVYDQTGSYTASNLYILESFYYTQDWMLPYIDNKVWNFMLDSGAFTFMEQKAQGVKAKIDNASMQWDDYVRRYADFILEHNIDLFFELDIDVVVGLDRVHQLRDLLEQRTGKRSIPVWHKSRGLDNWKQVVKEYDYVAIGGIVSGEIRRAERKFFNPMCDIAHDHNTRVHGLGVSPSGRDGLLSYRFDSVDSTNWTMGNRAGHIVYFDGKTIQKQPKPDGTKMKAREAAKHNFREWVKYQRYMKHAGWQMTTS